VEVKNDNSTRSFPQGFTVLLHSQIPHSDYQLLDFGNGRKLERVGQIVVDRPCPGANGQKNGSPFWKQTDLSFQQGPKSLWHYNSSCKIADSTIPWICQLDSIRLKLKPTPAGQIGIFPEHWSHWSWLSDQLHLDDSNSKRSRRVLNLFAYTGATTLYLASKGCAVTHVDASKPTMDWARENCKISGLEQRPIRWIQDDASLFAKREIKRGMNYEAILLDPPTFGHGVQGRRWEIHRDLVPLLVDCWQLLSDERCAVLLCGHSSHISIRQLNQQLLQQQGRVRFADCAVSKASIPCVDNRQLDCGFAAKYSFE
jgi:23S rRNA (cytosine1962-C5)-methyltransferase